MSPIWFAEDDDEKLNKIVESLNTTTGEDNLIINQIKKLITDLCHLKNTPLPELSELQIPGSSNLVFEYLNKNKKKNIFIFSIKSQGNEFIGEKKILATKIVNEDDDDDDDDFFDKNTIFKQDSEQVPKYHNLNFQV